MEEKSWIMFTKFISNRTKQNKTKQKKKKKKKKDIYCTVSIQNWRKGWSGGAVCSLSPTPTPTPTPTPGTGTAVD